MPSWLPDFIVILILVIIFAIPITYMIYNKVKKGHCGTCSCGCAAAMNNSKLKRVFKKDFKSKKEKEKAFKNSNGQQKCCCCKDETKASKTDDKKD